MVIEKQRSRQRQRQRRMAEAEKDGRAEVARPEVSGK